MNNTKKIASVAFTGAAVAGIAAAPAFAAGPPFHIKATTAHTGFHGAYSASASNTKLVDKTHPVTLTCTNATTNGNIPNSNPTTSDVGTVASAAFTNCTFLTVAFNAKLTAATSLFVKSANATSATGHIGNATKPIAASLKATNITCTATINGTSVPAKYVNANHSLNINSKSVATLTLNNVAATCPTIKTGDQAFFKGNYHVNSPVSLTIS